ncbi:DUF7619 domain-containing protein [Spirosoma foliorum]|uniref:DUF7619 domain-containing protein n=1 Tax=Spirosoma foliorum TaxID=2710596 RepID=A0A7G5H1J5_9BACT|nr:hypothetical protein [Spirosoma foliorum]QMW04987.1 hypothetical protein H3H32_08865 [Spirosoma foliorum]
MKVLLKAIDGLDRFKGGLEMENACGQIVPQAKRENPVNVPVINAQDPNDKLGPIGVNVSHYISAKDTLGYLIRFENYATATADAQYVQILDTLARTKFDFATF